LYSLGDGGEHAGLAAQNDAAFGWMQRRGAALETAAVAPSLKWAGQRSLATLRPKMAMSAASLSATSLHAWATSLFRSGAPSGFFFLLLVASGAGATGRFFAAAASLSAMLSSSVG
jgi:hypothetical protein